MPRIPYILLEEADQEPLATLRSQITGLRGRVLNLHRALANCPPALQAFMTTSEHVRDQSTLPPLLRELAIVTVAHCLDDGYELHQHEPIARTLGVTEAQLSDLENWQHSLAYSERERAVIAFAWQATVARRVDQPTIETIIRLLPPDQVVELALTVGWYHLCHVIIDSLGVEIE